ncbi:hypothetical protein OPT61_g3488 [Boeremia exigua]|uniref:Uncharacterized protein n=1 Tax=Boeremia exigua TaxID=749465 RepID=A0ACC2IHX8_9PLEO|nr:hypothetical protein OPT61_g3488 [Boeremia exigua]
MTANATNSEITACVVMLDLIGDGVFIPVVTYASDASDCTPPPRFTGWPFTMIVGPATAPTRKLDQKTSFDLYAPSSSLLTPTPDAVSTRITAVANDPTCTTTAGLFYEAISMSSAMFLGKSTASCPSEELVASNTYTRPCETSHPFSSQAPCTFHISPSASAWSNLPSIYLSKCHLSTLSTVTTAPLRPSSLQPAVSTSLLPTSRSQTLPTSLVASTPVPP